MGVGYKLDVVKLGSVTQKFGALGVGVLSIKSS